MGDTGGLAAQIVHPIDAVTDQTQGGQIMVASLLKELTNSVGDIQFGEGQEVELKASAGAILAYQMMGK